MTFKIETWTQEEASSHFKERLVQAKKAREYQEETWRSNETTVYKSSDEMYSGVGAADPNSDFDLPLSDSYVNINYTFNYVRFLHAQLSSNPPTSIPVPTSQDQFDREAAKSADQLIHYGRREYDTQEWQDVLTLDTMVYGTGWGRCSHCPTKGKILKVEKDVVFMEGDFDISNPSVWDVWIDPEASRWKDVRYVFIRHYMPREKAVSRWPEHADELEERKDKKGDGFFNSTLDNKADFTSNLVEVYEYIEKGLPWNGGVGRVMWGLDSGTLLTSVSQSPHPEASLPIHPLTDIDVPHKVYGKSIVEYLSRCQEILSGLDSTILDNVQAHGVVRLVLPDGAKLKNSNVTNNGWEYVEIAGNAGSSPFFMNPPSMMPDIYNFRNQLLQGMEMIAGINENMLGKQSREMSGYSMQTAINAGNMVRRRLFNKYTSIVNWFWNTFLMNIQLHWETPRVIKVSGEEGAYTMKKVSGADVASGFDIQTEYGVSFSLDPASRREEIMQLAPMLKEAGMGPRKILEKLHLNETKGMYDILELSRKRQLQIFDEMIDESEMGAAVYIAPEKYQEHQGMLEVAYEFVMLERYNNLEDDVKALIIRHIEEREALLVQATTPPPVQQEQVIMALPVV